MAVPLDSSAAKRLLIVDDDVTFLYALSESLRVRLAGVEVTTCNLPLVALRLLETTHYDVVVSDVKMPQMNGLELLAQIQARQPETATILITGYEEYPLAVRALRGGAYDIIQKPIDWDYFISVLNSAIQMRWLKRQQLIFQQQHPASDRPLLAELRVLIVDDDWDGREMEAAALRSFGATVQVASSVQTALAALETFEPDILVCDIRMPLEDGYSFIRKIRRRSGLQGGEIPALAVTAYGEEEALERSLKAGFQLQMAKPIEPDLLALTVASLAGRL